MKRSRHSLVAALAILTFMVLAATGEACTRVLWNNNKLAVVTSRTMDWPESTEPTLVVFPRGSKRDGGKVGDQVIVTDNAAKWTAKYGSMVTTIYGIGAIDGFNEKGVAIHLLFLSATDYGVRDTSRPAVHAGLWGQYLLDNAASVEEAIKLHHGIQVVMAEAHGHKATVHLAIEDSTGDSAIIEYIDGKPVVHHSRDFCVMTNDPTYDEQLKLLSKIDLSERNSEIPLPGNVNARDRFQRASYFLSLLPTPKNEREAIAGVLAVARNASVPFGAPYKGFGVYNTEYRTVVDVTNKLYFFELTTSPNVIWADLKKFDLSPGAPVKALDPDNIELSGDVTSKFQTVEKPLF